MIEEAPHMDRARARGLRLIGYTIIGCTHESELYLYCLIQSTRADLQTRVAVTILRATGYRGGPWKPELAAWKLQS